MKINFSNLAGAKIDRGVYDLAKLGCEISAHTPKEVAAKIGGCLSTKERTEVVRMLLEPSLDNGKWCCETTRHLGKTLEKNGYKPAKMEAFLSEIRMLENCGFVEFPKKSGSRREQFRNLFQPDIICITPALVRAIMQKNKIFNHS